MAHVANVFKFMTILNQIKNIFIADRRDSADGFIEKNFSSWIFGDAFHHHNCRLGVTYVKRSAGVEHSLKIFSLCIPDLPGHDDEAETRQLFVERHQHG